MQRRTVLLALLGAALATLPPARAADPEARGAAPVTLVMQGWWGGTKAADILLTASDGSERWRGSMQIRSAGIIHWLTGVETDIEGEGRVTRGALLPDDYRQHVTSYKSERMVELAFSGEPPLGRRLRDERIRVDPSATHDPEAVPDLPEEQRRDTIDPLAAILGLGHRALAGESRFTLPVYDGRRRYDLAVQVAGHRRVPIDGHDRDVIAVNLVMHPIAGFNRYHLRWWTNAAFTAALDPATGLPLRIASDSFMVSVVLTTKLVCPPAEGCQLPAGK